MNIAVTRPADGLPRRAFSVADVERMMEAGVLGEDERFELIEGDLVMMAAKHIGHERIKYALIAALVRAAPDDMVVAVEGSLQLADDILVEPDLAVIARSVYRADRKTFAQPRPEDVLLLIEVAASSLDYDRRVKSRLYARHGIREYWVIDAGQGLTWVHTAPSGEGYASVIAHSPEETLSSSALPRLAVRIGDID